MNRIAFKISFCYNFSWIIEFRFELKITTRKRERSLRLESRLRPGPTHFKASSNWGALSDQWDNLIRWNEDEFLRLPSGEQKLFQSDSPFVEVQGSGKRSRFAML